MPNGESPSVTLWACQCCTLVMANGECCDSQHDYDDSRHDKEPLSTIPRGCDASLGLFALEHSEDCSNNPEWIGAECDCERREFTWSTCDGCDSNLGGSRNAFVIWFPAAPGSCPKCRAECYFTHQTQSGINWFRCGNRDCGTSYDSEDLSTVA